MMLLKDAGLIVKLDTYKDGYREYPKYATFMPIEGSDAYMAGGHYTGAYKTG